MQTVIYVHIPVIITFLALLSGGCSAVMVGPTCNVESNPYCISVLEVGEGVSEGSYNVPEATRLADHFLTHMVPHFAERTSQEAAEAAGREAVFYTSAYIFPHEEELQLACGVEVPDGYTLHGCTRTETGDVLLLDRGRFCDSAFIHELNHKLMKSLLDDWGYEHVDESWQVVGQADDGACE